jgi:alkanesulfonate monooxygenase SsuD/methylene tetrahydromethanopterin reductase-like flavin-dependent oxidoreductase (luciferase family)
VKLGAFVMPSHSPARAPLDGYRRHLEPLVTLDRLDFHEAWIGERFPAPGEANPAPDLSIARALRRTQSIELCPAAHRLPLQRLAEEVLPHFPD